MRVRNAVIEGSWLGKPAADKLSNHYTPLDPYLATTNDLQMVHDIELVAYLQVATKFTGEVI